MTEDKKLKYQLFWFILIFGLCLFFFFQFLDMNNENRELKIEVEKWKGLAEIWENGEKDMQIIAQQWKTRAILCEINN